MSRGFASEEAAVTYIVCLVVLTMLLTCSGLLIWLCRIRTRNRDGSSGFYGTGFGRGYNNMYNRSTPIVVTTIQTIPATGQNDPNAFQQHPQVITQSVQAYYPNTQRIN